MNQDICNFNHMGFCKFVIECFKYNEDDICKARNCAPQKCRKHHPRVCKYFREYSFCKFGQDCAFIHNEVVKSNELKSMMEDIKTIHTEVDVLKNNVKSLLSIKQEGKVLKKYMDHMKEEIFYLMAIVFLIQDKSATYK